jgi:hypothetical protein
MSTEQTKSQKLVKSVKREFALIHAPTEKENAEGKNVLLTADEKIAEAEKIYQWLIKDL